MKVQELLGDRLGEEIHMYSITLKPEQDSPAVLAQYAAEWGMKPGWTLLTGAPKDVQLLRRNLGYYDPEEPDFGVYLDTHLGFLLMGNEPYGWWGTCSSTSAPTQIVQLLEWNVPDATGKTPAMKQ